MNNNKTLQPKEGHFILFDQYGNPCYQKFAPIVGYEDKKVVLTRSQSFTTPRFPKNAQVTVTLIGAGGSDGSAGYIESKTFNLKYIQRTFEVSIGKAGLDGAPGEPTSFGDLLCANGGFMNNSSIGLEENGKHYGYGANDSSPATDGVCIVEWKEPIWGR